jgi:hypothetical protein
MNGAKKFTPDARWAKHSGSLAHLNKFADDYTRLAPMESEAEEDQGKSGAVAVQATVTCLPFHASNATKDTGRGLRRGSCPTT